MKCVTAFLFEILCELTLISRSQKRWPVSRSVGAAFSPDAVSLCCAEVEGQEHLMLCHCEEIREVYVTTACYILIKNKQTDA